MSESKPTNSFFTRGGARIGFVNYSWPLASLAADSDGITITTTMFGIFETGRYRFRPEDITAIERFGVIPFIGEGIRIRHVVADNPEKIVFWCRPERVLAGIARVGLAASAPAVVTSSTAKRGFPFRIGPVVIAVIIWNLLLVCDFLDRRFPGPLAFIAVALLLCVSTSALQNPSVQRWLLRPGRSIGEVRPLLLLLATVSGIMSVVFGLMLITGMLR